MKTVTPGNTKSENSGARQCVRCVMDASAVDIRFNEDGHCSFCCEFIERSSQIIFEADQEKQKRLRQLVSQIKQAGKKSPYDCVVGVSGGVDSSFALVEVKRLGLRPLAVHMDNGWNSELAQNNIARLVKGLGVDLYTHVIDWEEYKALMNAFFEADVIDVELLYDNAMLAVNYEQAQRFGIRYILAGTNQVSEGMRMPQNWNWFKFDKKQIVNLAHKSGLRKLRTFPSIGTFYFLWLHFVRRIQWISFLDYVPYNKQQAMRFLRTEFGYKPYPYKHYESVFTRFYQGYILPTKFGVDKRKLHLSTLVISGQMSREEALLKLADSPYPSDDDLKTDISYFLKKMEWSDKRLQEYLARSPVSHSEYPSEQPLWQQLLSIYRRLKGEGGLWK